MDFTRYVEQNLNIHLYHSNMLQFVISRLIRAMLHTTSSLSYNRECSITLYISHLSRHDVDMFNISSRHVDNLQLRRQNDLLWENDETNYFIISTTISSQVRLNEEIFWQGQRQKSYDGCLVPIVYHLIKMLAHFCEYAGCSDKLVSTWKSIVSRKLDILGRKLWHVGNWTSTFWHKSSVWKSTGFKKKLNLKWKHILTWSSVKTLYGMLIQ